MPAKPEIVFIPISLHNFSVKCVFDGRAEVSKDNVRTLIKLMICLGNVEK